MSTKPTRSPAVSDEVTVVVFKDNDASRSFQVSLGWISRFGLALGCLVLATLIGGFFSLKFYRIAHTLDPSHLGDLEQQLSDLRATNKTLEAKLATAPSAPAATPGATAAATSVNPLPVPTVTVTVTPVAAASQPKPGTATPAGAVTLFSAFPRQTQDLSADSGKLPITVSPAHVSWSGSGRTLKVNFNIQYTGTDHGSQQGHVIVLARGTNGVLGYPEGVLASAGSESLITPQKGEYFSVSRFREVKADFAETRGAGTIQNVEILVVNHEYNLVFYQKIAAPVSPAAKASPKASSSAPVSEPPGAASSDIITPAIPGAAADPVSPTVPGAHL